MYYFAVHPQFIVSVVERGRLPEKLPNWLISRDLFCAKTPSNCFQLYSGPVHEAFILELDFPESLGLEVTGVSLKQIDPKLIKRIFIHSEKSRRVLNNLFQKGCPVNIVVEEALYPQIRSDFKKREREPGEESPVKKLMLNSGSRAVSFNSFFMNTVPGNPVFVAPVLAPVSPSKSAQNRLPVVSRISSYAEHLFFLSDAFKIAQRSILITSFSINHDTLFRANLYELIPQARSRGVKIYIYFNDKKSLTHQVMEFLDYNGVVFDQSFTHSKILAVDRCLVVAGSCNWLSMSNARYSDNDEGSLVVRGRVSSKLIEEFWAHLKYYRNVQFDNVQAINKFEANADNQAIVCFDIDDKTELGYVPVLEQHRAFLQDAFIKAKHRVIIVSPFVASSGCYQKDLDHDLLRQATMRGVDVFFVCSRSSEALGSFDAFLSQLNSPKIHLIPLENIHLKTMIIDDLLIAEGSFNWLSASRHQGSHFHNHEQTLYLEGAAAKEVINQFFQSSTGLKIQAEMQKPATAVYQRAVPGAVYVHQNIQKQMALPVSPQPVPFVGGSFGRPFSAANPFYQPPQYPLPEFALGVFYRGHNHLPVPAMMPPQSAPFLMGMFHPQYSVTQFSQPSYAPSQFFSNKLVRTQASQQNRPGFHNDESDSETEPVDYNFVT